MQFIKVLSILLALLSAALSVSAASLESWPRIFPSGHEAEVAIAIHDPEILAHIGRIEMRYKCDDNRGADGKRFPFKGQKIDFRFADGKVYTRIAFRGEQQYTIHFALPKGDDVPEERMLGSITFFTLGPELFRLRPFKGDFHTHCVKSGHGRLESPETAAHGRKVGLDFMALTEHRMIQPAIEAKEKMAEYDSGFEVIVGEESHATFRVGGSMIHMLSVGVNQSVTEHLFSNKAWFEREIAKRKKELPAGLKLDDRDREEVVSSEIMADLARQFGGIAILAHPFWHPHGAFNATLEYSREIIRRGNYDAWELVVGDGGGDEAIFKSIAFYNDLLKEGATTNVVGTSDCHDGASPLFGHRYTMIFADSNRTADVLAAIRAGRSLGVRRFTTHTPEGILGDYKYINYAYFLSREYFPEHDRLCARQGELLLKAVAGDDSTAPAIAKLRTEIDSHRERFFYSQ